MSRDPFYIGAQECTTPENLIRYEKSKKWLAMPKQDGMWARLTFGKRANELVSRNAKPITGRNAGELLTLPVGADGVVVIGELMAATEYSAKLYEETGFRQMVLFDIAVGPDGVDLYGTMGWRSRYEALRRWRAAWPDAIRRHLLLCKARTTGFRELYETEAQAGREGIMLWRRDQKVTGRTRASGKTHDLVKCKKKLTKSYVLCGTAKTSTSGSITGRWGLFTAKGQLKDVLQAPFKGITAETAAVRMGQVADFEGFEVFRSGSMRSAQFVDWRPDLDADECRFERVR